MSCEDVCSVETREWRLAFDVSSTHRGGGARVMLYALDGTDMSLSFKLELPCSNNKADYEAL